MVRLFSLMCCLRRSKAGCWEKHLESVLRPFPPPFSFPACKRPLDLAQKNSQRKIDSNKVTSSLSSLFVFLNVIGLFKKRIGFFSVTGNPLTGLLSVPKDAVSSSLTVKDAKEREKYLDGSLEVHVSSLVGSLRVWIEVHFKVDSTCIFCRRWNELQLPCHLIILTDLLLSLEGEPQSGKQVCFQLLIAHDLNLLTEAGCLFNNVG